MEQKKILIMHRHEEDDHKVMDDYGNLVYSTDLLCDSELAIIKKQGFILNHWALYLEVY